MKPATLLRGIALAAAAGAAATAAAYRLWPRPVVQEKLPEFSEPKGRFVTLVGTVSMSDLKTRYLEADTWTEIPRIGPAIQIGADVFESYLGYPFDAWCRRDMSAALTMALSPLAPLGMQVCVNCDDTNNPPADIAINRRRAKLWINDGRGGVYHVWYDFFPEKAPAHGH